MQRSQLPEVTDATAERVQQAPDYQKGTAWDRMPPEFAAIARIGLIEADRARHEAQLATLDPGDLLLRGIGLAIAIIREQVESDSFIREIESTN